MFAFLTKLLLVARSRLKSRASLEAENLVLHLVSQYTHLKRHWARKPRRCQRITVSGLTTVIAFRIAGKNRYSQTKISRSMSGAAPATGTGGLKRSPADAERGTKHPARRG
jgi:hypothetical protein